MDWGHLAAVVSSSATLIGFAVLYTKVVRSYTQTQADIAETKKDIASTKADVASTKVDVAKARDDIAATKSAIASARDDIAETKADMTDAVKQQEQLHTELTKHMAPDSPLQHINPEMERRAYEESKAHRQWVGNKIEKIDEKMGDLLRALVK